MNARSSLIVVLLAGAFALSFIALPDQLSNFRPTLAFSFALGWLLKRPGLCWIAVVAEAIRIGPSFDSLPALATHAGIFWLGTRLSSGGWRSALGGAALAALAFYLITNAASWLTNPVYAKNPAGLWQSLTTGEPGFPPTWMFFRNSLASTTLWTAFLLFPVLARARPAAHLAPACGKV